MEVSKFEKLKLKTRIEISTLEKPKLKLKL